VQERKEKKKSEKEEEDKLLTSPTGKGIRNDAGGLGHFGAPRGKKDGKPRFHEGIDFSATVGQNILAPFEGNATNRIGKDTKALLVDIWPKKRYPEFDYLQILYVDKPEEIQWDVPRHVEEGKAVGVAANLQKLTKPYPSNVGPHVHVQLWKGNSRINPTVFFFKD